MKTVLFGGSFNPPHNAHLAMAQDLVAMGYTQIIVVPAYTSLLKETPKNSPSPQDRYTMAELAFQGLPLIVDPFEIEQGSTQYAINVVEHIYRKYEVTGKVHMFIGDDHLQHLHRWHRWKELESEITLLVAPRYLESLSREVACQVIPLEREIISLSSTEIRSLIGQGKQISHLVPKKVAQYIEKKSLY